MNRYQYHEAGRRPRTSTWTAWAWSGEATTSPRRTRPRKCSSVATSHRTGTSTAGIPPPSSGAGASRVQSTTAPGSGSPDATPRANRPSGRSAGTFGGRDPGCPSDPQPGGPNPTSGIAAPAATAPVRNRRRDALVGRSSLVVMGPLSPSRARTVPGRRPLRRQGEGGDGLVGAVDEEAAVAHDESAGRPGDRQGDQRRTAGRSAPAGVVGDDRAVVGRHVDDAAAADRVGGRRPRQRRRPLRAAGGRAAAGPVERR